MITMLLVFCIFMLIVFLLALVTGLIAISPALVVVIAFVALDVCVVKLLFFRKKK